MKTDKLNLRRAKTPTSLDTNPVRSDSALSAQLGAEELMFDEVHSKDADQTGRLHVRRII